MLPTFSPVKDGCSLVLGILLLLPAWQGGAPAPRVFLLDAVRLSASRAAIARDDPATRAAWLALRADADRALAAGPFSVVTKAVAPPSGDKHDYMSQAPYFWPNPATPDHLPYVRRDGERNPEINRITDHATLDGMIGAVDTLALASYLGADDRYATRAAVLLRAWFLDRDTRMNPHLEYAQFIPGVNTGRGIGLIETRGLTRVVDAIGLLETSPIWRRADGDALRRWFAEFLTWMEDSRNGRDESAAKNNHGTFYDLQLASYSLLVDRVSHAREILEAAKVKRIAVQIEPDGRQPLELARTNAWGYSTMNLDGLTQLAVLGDRVGVDLWGFQTADRRGIRTAIEYLAPFAFDGVKWPHAQISAFTPAALFPAVRRAALHYRDDAFDRLRVKLPAPLAADRGMLIGTR